MFGKTPVTALEEYCAKKNLPKPLYEITDAEDGSKLFVCIVQAIDEIADGIGRSKKEAKHDGAANLIQKLKSSHPDIDSIPQVFHETMPTSDAVADLRDICIQRNHPLPKFDVIQQTGPPEAPEFTVECKIATITRFATSSTKKGAKQLAAQKLIDIIQMFPTEKHQMTVATLADASEEANVETLKKFKTYREYIESDFKDVPIGVCIIDRHNFFRNYDPLLKADALQILHSNSYLSDHEKIEDMLKALKIKTTTETIMMKSGPKLYIELMCEYVAPFVGNKETVYTKMVEYFKEMFV